MDNNEIQFREEDHTYWFCDRRVPSVTQLMKPLFDFEWINKEILERKSAIGSAVHKATEIFDLGMQFESDLHPLVRPYFDAYRRFTDEVNPKWQGIEERVHNKLLGYAGTLDRFGVINDLDSLLDIKCVATVSAGAFVQCSAYAEARGNPTAKRFALQLKPDGKFELHESKAAHREDFGVFISCITQHRWKAKYAK